MRPLFRGSARVSALTRGVTLSQAGIAQKECSHAQTGLRWPAVCRGYVGKRLGFGSCLGVVLSRVWLCARLRLWLLTLALPLILSTEIFLWRGLLSSARLWLAWLGLARLGLAWSGMGRLGLAWPGMGRAGLAAMVGPDRDRRGVSRSCLRWAAR